MDLFNLKGKKALVTGASSGLGVQFAKALASQGCDVAIVARRVEKLNSLAEEIKKLNVNCLPVQCDVTNEQNIKDAVSKVEKEFGRIDILVNNAGVVEFSDTLEHHTTEQWNKVINTDLTAVFLFAREVSNVMKKNKYGRIINTASVGGLLAGPNQFGYYAAKAGVVNLTRALASELASYNITVNAIGPGVFETEMTKDSLNGDFANYLNMRCPARRIGKSGELDTTLLYFASPYSSYTTGQTIYVDGGLTSVL